MNSPLRGRRGLRSRGPVELSDSETKVSSSSESDSDYEEENKNNKGKLNKGDEDETDSDKAKKSMRPPPTKTKGNVPKGAVRQTPLSENKGGNRAKKDTGGGKKDALPSLPVCLSCLFLMLFAIWLYDSVFLAASMPVVPPPKDRLDAFLSKLDELKIKFPNQSDRFWSVIAAAPMNHLKDYGKIERPVVVLLVGQPGMSATTACITDHVAELYTVGLGGTSHGIAPISSNGSHFIDADSDFTKQKIDLALRRGFNAASKAAIIHDFDKLPACTALLFHSYCENDNAPYKDVAIILTLELDQTIAMVTKEVDRHVNHHLGKHWASCPDFEERGKIEAMLSRVANNIALVSKEKTACK